MLLSESIGVPRSLLLGANGAEVGDIHGTPAAEGMDEPASVPTHPLGVKPLGNQYLSSTRNARHSIGSLQAMPDEMLMIVLEACDQQSLQMLGSACRFLFAFCYSDDLWKPLFLKAQYENPGTFTWLGTWRSTLLELPQERQAIVDCSNVFSDVLHRPFVCSNIALGDLVSDIPASNQIQRFEDMSYDEFTRGWKDTPFILTKCIQSWPAYRNWTIDKMLEMYPEVDFRAEAVDWPFSTYYQYVFNTRDESPLYLFDKKFAEKMDIIVGEHENAAYWPPRCFGLDLFELLGAERPAHRWLIIGSERSGSTFHKDPNATSAWNAVVQGAKYWIMFPPCVSVPGVYVSADSSEVTSPLSIAEWLLEFHAEARRLPQCVEGICRAGEILHVPSGWWHLVVNLEKGIAITQNFVPEAHLSEVLSFLKDKPDQVTGFKEDICDPYGLFVDRLENTHPLLLEACLEDMERKRAPKKRKWDLTIGAAEREQQVQTSSFSFGFGGDDIEIP